MLGFPFPMCFLHFVCTLLLQIGKAITFRNASIKIRHHDALVDIVCCALSQSHLGVLKKQCAFVEVQLMCIILTFSVTALPVSSHCHPVSLLSLVLGLLL